MDTPVPGLQIRLIEASTEAFVVADESGQIQFVNPAACALFGYTAAEMRSLRVENLMPRSKRDGHHQHRASYHARPERKPMGMGRNLKALRKDGSQMYVEISLNPVETDSGSWVCAMITDVDEKVRLHQENERLNQRLASLLEDKTRELDKTQQLYQAVARNYPNGMICVLDRDFKCVFAEGKSLSELRMSSKALEGTDYLAHVPESVREEIQSMLMATLETGASSHEVEHEGASFQLDAVRLDGPNAGQILIIEQDISKAVQALKKEKEVNEWTSRFVSMASHEFRTPLSAISLSADLSLRHLDQGNTDRLEPHLGKIQNNVKQLIGILNDYLNLERLENSNLEDALTRFDLVALLEKCMAEAQVSAGQNQRVHFEWDDALDAHRHIIASQEAVAGVVSNLLSNALKYSADDLDVCVRLSQQGGMWNVEVEDRGVGISQNDLPHVFQRFFRAQNVQHIPGTGVGLDLVSRYARALNGSIHCTSTEGKGSTFTLIWPIEPPSTSRP